MHILRLLLPVLQFVGFGLILGYIAKSYRKVRERQVLSVFRNTDPDGPWRSENGVVGELYLKNALRDARGFFAPRHLTFPSYVRMNFSRCRHALRRCSSQGRNRRTTSCTSCGSEGCLCTPDVTTTENEFYRLRN